MKIEDDFPLFAYGAHAPAQSHSPTSLAAAASIEPRLGKLQLKVLAYLQATPEGATDEEMQTALAMGSNTQRPRRRELQLAGLLKDSGRTRPLRSGKDAAVWITCNEPPITAETTTNPGEPMTDVPIDEQVTCVKREIAMRERVYPRWVASNRMTPAKAKTEIETMKAVLATLEAEASKGRLL